LKDFIYRPNGLVKKYCRDCQPVPADPIGLSLVCSHNRIRVARLVNARTSSTYFLGSVYTWRTLTGLKLNNNWTQYSRRAIIWQCNQDTKPELH